MSTATTELKTTLDTIGAAVTGDPAAAGVEFRAASDLAGLLEVDGTVRRHSVTVDEPESLGGGDAGPNPVEYALLALGSCWAITYRFWAAKLGMRIDSCTVDVSGALDVRGVFGLDEVRPGFTDVRVRIELAGPESAEDYSALARAVEAHCPVRDIFANPTPVTAVVQTV